MRLGLLEHLCCPDCREPLTLQERQSDGVHVMAGSLSCRTCLAEFPILDGVPCFVLADGSSAVEQTTRGFATNWRRYSDAILARPALNDELFRDWIAPVSPELFHDAVVLDAGCGMGRWLTAAAPHAPRALIGFDYSDVVHAAFENTRHLKHVHIVRADLFRPPFRRRCADFCYSIGVVHHTAEPERAFASLLDVVQDNGALSVWVYGQENNAWVENVVTPLRESLTSHLPDLALHALSRTAAAQLALASALYVRMFPSATRLSYDAYLRHLRKYPQRYLEHIVYDHLVPQLAHYLPRAELERWATSRELSFVLTHRNANSWRLLTARSLTALSRWSSTGDGGRG